MRRIVWNRRASNVNDDMMGIGIKSREYKSKCGKFKVVSNKFKGESELWTPFVLDTQLDGTISFRHLHRDPTRRHRTKKSATKTCKEYLLTVLKERK